MAPVSTPIETGIPELQGSQQGVSQHTGAEQAFMRPISGGARRR
jgi:hypothetical protein